ncbi:MAG: endonuclease/exonuclease/phosphatase family protein [Candidatus Latescibacterota bacterium]|nr:endonuclease/exonuclease/phosphatase family protein [Candidatus Latescibacterota bacterium]
MTERGLILWSHNAHWFQGAPSLWREERAAPHPVALTALTDLYASLSPDLLLLQEVPGAEVAEELGGRLDMHGHFCPGGERPEYGGSIMWHRDLTGDVDDPSSCRTPVGCKFERICMHLRINVGAHCLSLLNVHLPSNRFAPHRRGEPLRLAEIETAFDAVDSPDVVAGDFNERPDSSVYEYMQRRGYCDPHHNDSAERRIDYVWTRENRIQSRPLLSPEAFEISAYEGTAMSDHRPVGAEITLT